MQITTDGTPVEITAPRHRAVLAMLLLDVNRVVSVDRLIEAVWSDAPPSTVRSQIYTCISGLRRLLRRTALPVRILTKAPGYQLLAPADSVDLHVFDRLVREAAAARARSDPEAAADVLRRALALWQGDPLAGVEGELIEAAAARLAERRLDVLEQRFELELELGKHHQVLHELTAEAESHPLRERLWSLLMIALYRSGRQAEALSQFQVVRGRLIDELGLEPGQELRTAERIILTDGAAASIPPPPAPPVSPPAPPAAFSTVSAPYVAPRTLPTDSPHYVGRQTYVSRLHAKLAAVVPHGERPHTPPVAVLTGPPGVGKTALGVHIAHQLYDAFPDGQLYLSLSEKGMPITADRALERMLAMLGVPGYLLPESLEERAALFRSRIADRRILIMLDDAADDAQVAALLPGSSSCGLIITSRWRLAGIPGADVVEVDPLSPQDAIDLLMNVVGQARVLAEPAAALELVTLCGRLPLALRIAAARLAGRPHWSVAQLVDLLSAGERWLDELSYGTLSVRDSLASTYERLPAPTRRLFRLLSVLTVQDFPVWIAAPLLGEAHHGHDLEILVDAHLIDVVRGHGVFARYAMPELVLLYARELLAAEPEDEQHAALDRALAAWLTLAEQAHRREHGGDLARIHGRTPRWTLSDDLVDQLLAEPVEWFDQEHAAIVTAARQAAAHGYAETGWDLSLTVVPFLEARCAWDDWRSTHEAALVACRAQNNRRGEAAMLYSLGVLALEQQRLDEASAHLGLAMRVFTEVGEAHGRALGLRHLGALDHLRGHTDQAISRYEESIDLLRDLGDPVTEADVLCRLAGIMIDRGDRNRAEKLLENALRLVWEAGCRPVEIHIRQRQGDLYLNDDDLERAEMHFSLALEEARLGRNQLAEAAALLGIGIVQHREGLLDQAVGTVEQAHGLGRRCGERTLSGRCRVVLAELFCDTDRIDEAHNSVQQALSLLSQTGDAVWQKRALTVLARVRTHLSPPSAEGA
ncbi:AfsR/SARP family transcriptional regulator [Nonomuraea solani]|uniref:AfsR/SARP family transcriptional regulator n=1 Tax=Nonomuraea solani TaxID=1144553 RepID=UPI0011AFF46C|nr:BTAD domain-containing putative transcriptional regulator [Nonomuraea solani]